VPVVFTVSRTTVLCFDFEEQDRNREQWYGRLVTENGSDGSIDFGFVQDERFITSPLSGSFALLITRYLTSKERILARQVSRSHDGVNELYGFVEPLDVAFFEELVDSNLVPRTLSECASSILLSPLCLLLFRRGESDQMIEEVMERSIRRFFSMTFCTVVDDPVRRKKKTWYDLGFSFTSS